MKKISLDLSLPFLGKLDNWKNPSQYCREASENWYYLHRFAISYFNEKLEQSEINFLIDLYNGHIFSNNLEKKVTFDMMVDDSELDNLPEKWEVDIEKLKSKITTDLEAYLLSFLVCNLRLELK